MSASAERERDREREKEREFQKKKHVTRLRRDKNAPKRPKTAFICFSEEQRPRLKQLDPSLDFAGIGKKLADLWRSVTPDEKKRYEDIASADKIRYQHEKERYDEELQQIQKEQEKQEKIRKEEELTERRKAEASSSSLTDAAVAASRAALDVTALSVFARDLLQDLCRVSHSALPHELLQPSSYASLLAATRQAIQSNLRIVTVVQDPYDDMPQVALFHESVNKDTTNALIQSMNIDDGDIRRFISGGHGNDEGYKERRLWDGGSKEEKKLVKVLKVHPFPVELIGTAKQNDDEDEEQEEDEI